MVRPECYECARCRKPWSEFYPAVTCPCGCDVLARRRRHIPDLKTVAMWWLSSSFHWSPYPVGNGTEGTHA